MAYTTVAKPRDNFGGQRWQGTGAEHAITGIGHRPDLVIHKDREEAHSWGCYDSTRGATKFVDCDTSTAEGTDAQGLKSFDADGFTLGTSVTDPVSNKSGNEYVGFGWKANAGTTASNTNGTITSTVQANTAGGFSIVTYTGTGAAGTIGHGLRAAPKMIIIKARNNGASWSVFHGGTEVTSDPATDFLRLNTTDGATDSAEYFNDVMPTATVFSVGADTTNGEANYSAWTYVAYCFAQVQGYSHFGTYWGNDNAEGPILYCGFRPALVMVKRTDGTENWMIHTIETSKVEKDGTAADGGNPLEKGLVVNTGAVENTNAPDMDFYSTGFKPRDTDANHNGDNYKYIYMAFADASIVGTNGTVGLAF